MKKLWILAIASVCLLSCSSSDDYDSASEELITMVAADDAQRESVEEFFNAEFRNISRPTGFFGNQSEPECKGYIVNNYADLKALYSGSRELPDIDFDKYTLIIGVTALPTSSHSLTFKRQELVRTDVGLVNTIYFEADRDLFYPAIVGYWYYWGLYPKMDDRSFNTIVCINGHIMGSYKGNFYD